MDNAGDDTSVRRQPPGALAGALLFALLFAASAASASSAVPPRLGGGDPLTRLNPNPLLLATGNPAVPGGDPTRWKTEVAATARPNQVWDPSPEFLRLRGEYDLERFSFKTELGDISIDETPYLAHDLSRRGARVWLQAGGGPAVARLSTFAGTGVNAAGTNGVLVGATGELSLLSDLARFKTVFLSGREALDPASRTSGERRGESLGFLATLEPFKGKLAAEAEVDFSQVDPNTHASEQGQTDMAYRVKVGGALSNYRYSALYTFTGPQYRVVSGSGPQPNNAGVALTMGADFQVHALDLNLSRYNDNTGDSDLHPTLYRQEGVLGYTFKGIKSLPFGLQYKKTLLTSAREPEGVAPRDIDTDALTSRVNYLVKNWDFGLSWNFQQQTDRLRDARESIAHTVRFAPKYQGKGFSVAPDFSLRRSRDFVAAVDKDTYAVNLDLKGSLLTNRFGYEMKSGYSKDVASVPSAASESFGTRIKLGCDVSKIRKNPILASIGIKGEYNRTIPGDTTAGRSDYTVMVVLDSAKNLF